MNIEDIRLSEISKAQKTRYIQFIFCETSGIDVKFTETENGLRSEENGELLLHGYRVIINLFGVIIKLRNKIIVMVEQPCGFC